MQWRQGKPIERAVRCGGCGGNRAVAECTVANTSNGCVFACSAHCERAIEKRGAYQQPPLNFQAEDALENGLS